MKAIARYFASFGFGSGRWAAGSAALAVLAGCHTLPPQPPMNLTEAGWVVRQGQAVWRTGTNRSEIAGDLLVAMHSDGRALVQFTKPPLPLVTAQKFTNGWQAQFFAQKRTYSGRGEPPDRILWLHLPDGLSGRHSSTNWLFTRAAEGWHFESLTTDETLDGFLATIRLPKTHRVRAGETLNRVARWYGVPVENLRAVNAGPDSSWFRVGSDINLPPSAPAQ